MLPVRLGKSTAVIAHKKRPWGRQNTYNFLSVLKWFSPTAKPVLIPNSRDLRPPWRLPAYVVRACHWWKRSHVLRSRNERDEKQVGRKWIFWCVRRPPLLRARHVCSFLSLIRIMMIGKSRPDGSRLFVSFHFCLLLFVVVASQELRHPISSLWSLSLKSFPFSSPLGLMRVCFLPLYPFFFFFYWRLYLFIYIFSLPSWITCWLCGHWVAAGWVPLCSRWSIKPLFSSTQGAGRCSRRPWHVLVLPPPSGACTRRSTSASAEL